MPTIKIPFGALRTKSYAADRRRWRKQFIFLLSTFFFLFAFDHREYCLGQLMLDEVRIEAFSVNNPFPAVLHLPVWTHLATTLAPCVSMCVCVWPYPFQPNCSSYSKLLIAQKKKEKKRRETKLSIHSIYYTLPAETHNPFSFWIHTLACLLWACKIIARKGWWQLKFQLESI